VRRAGRGSVEHLRLLPAVAPIRIRRSSARVSHLFAAGLRRETPEDYPERSVQFTGFALPRKTNLVSKWLLIVSGDYDLLKAATPFGHFKANSITFERARFDEGSAGHLTLHIIYSWKHGKSAIHFDFEHRSVNIYNFDPSQRPAEYDRAAQIKITEQIMSTFRTL